MESRSTLPPQEADVADEDLSKGWITDQFGSTSAVFRSERYNLSVKVVPQYRSSASQGKSSVQQPKSYQVKVVQDWFSTGVHGNRSMNTNVETWEEALEAAREFMQEFEHKRTDQTPEEAETTHRCITDPETVAEVLTNGDSTDALANSPGYSDDLLLDVLEEETDHQYRVVAHRDGDEIEYVAGGDDPCLETLPLERMYATFSVDKLGLDSLLGEADELVTTINIGEFIVYRFIASNTTETDIILTQETQVVSPAFENTIWNVLGKKW